MTTSNFRKIEPSFWQGKRVFLTGHTGFKGGWLSLWLSSMGAKVTGYALTPNTTPNFYEVANIWDVVEKSFIEDIRDLDKLSSAISSTNPEIIIHMAAQPLVRYSYVNPVETYATNVMGTVNLLESIRRINSVRATIIVTTDKCYENQEWHWGYREIDPMGGYDPYSSSKGCAELVTSAYRYSFFSSSNFQTHGNALASARAGNVIGGGDWSNDRLIPDAFRAFQDGVPLLIRNPTATRPWQHVLEPLSGYLILAQALYQNGADFASAWNFGPQEEDVRSVEELIEILIAKTSIKASWRRDSSEQVHEAHCLKLDCSKANQLLGWRPKLSLESTVDYITEWQRAFLAREDMQKISLEQINTYSSKQSRN